MPTAQLRLEHQSTWQDCQSAGPDFPAVKTEINAVRLSYQKGKISAAPLHSSYAPRSLRRSQATCHNAGRKPIIDGQVTIRGCQPEQFNAIADLLNRAFEVKRSCVDEPPETHDSVAASMMIGTYFVAVDSQGQLIGCVYVHNGLWAIFKLAVEQSQRRQGYGRLLMAEAEKYGKKARWPAVRIAILDFRSDLLEIYQHLGYGQTGETRQLAPPARAIQPCHLIIMAKKLA